MKCEHCGAKIVGDPTFCAACGKPTALLSSELSAISALRYAKKNLDWKRSWKLSLLMFVPIWLFAASFLLLGDFWYYLSLLIFLPLFLSPLSKKSAWFQKPLGFFPFAVLFVGYLFALRTICQGDPILDLVYLIMCNYALSISLPIVAKVGKGEKLLASLLWSIRKIKESRWQQIFLLWIVFALNILALLPLGIGLFFSVPFSYICLERYGHQLKKYYKKAE